MQLELLLAAKSRIAMLEAIIFSFLFFSVMLQDFSSKRLSGELFTLGNRSFGIHSDTDSHF